MRTRNVITILLLLPLAAVLYSFSVLDTKDVQIASQTNLLEASNPEVEAQERTVTPKVKAGLGISGKLHRRGGGCDCIMCFGFCDVKVKPFIEISRLVVEIGEGQGTLYFPSPIAHAEPAFFVDDPIVLDIPTEIETDYQQVTILPSQYQYSSTTVNYELNGQTFTSYGSVSVNVQFN